MVNLCQRWAEEYMKINPQVRVVVTGGGSGNGITALLNGSADFACMSRELLPEELTRAKKRGIKLTSVKTAYDGITIAVNSTNRIEELSLSELKGIFTGKIKNFKEVGGEDSPINLYGRDNNSGTFNIFKEQILKGNDFASSTQMLQGTAQLATAIAGDRKGIAYGGIGYFIKKNGVKVIKIKGINGEESKSPVEQDHPNYKEIRSGKYLISRPLLLVSANKQKNGMDEFIRFVLSGEGQKIVAGMNYIPFN
jgi:phosphate transport system substrate-binding protein